MRVSKTKRLILICFSVLVLGLNACTSVATFPTVARAGDTVSVMVGGSDKARKETVLVTLTDFDGIQWDLQALNKVRSVFNLRADAKAKGTHYSKYLDLYSSWSQGHEPVQTVLVIDVPAGVATGAASISINTLVDDDSSGISSPYTINIDVIPGVGSADNFLRQQFLDLPVAVDFEKLEPASHAKISFGIDSGITIGAASLVVDFDELVVAPGDINVYAPESTVRGSFVETGSFGETQRMVYWRQDGQQLFIDIVAPQGIYQTFLQLFIIHPDVAGSPNFNITSSTVYDTSGNEILLIPGLEYFQ